MFDWDRYLRGSRLQALTGFASCAAGDSCQRCRCCYFWQLESCQNCSLQPWHKLCHLHFPHPPYGALRRHGHPQVSSSDAFQEELSPSCQVWLGSLQLLFQQLSYLRRRRWGCCCYCWHCCCSQNCQTKIGSLSSCSSQVVIKSRLFWTLFRHPGILKVPTFWVFTSSFVFFSRVLTFFMIFS